MGFFKRVFKRKPKGDDPEDTKPSLVKDRSSTSSKKEEVVTTPKPRKIRPVVERRDDNIRSSPASATVEQPVAKPGPPPAREAAFRGPPRFDWMDIETNAAIKIQSIFRRNQVMDLLEENGHSTFAIRNRKRRRKASRKLVSSEDAPSLLACCAVGLAFGDATEEDEAAYREFQRKQYEERVQQQQMHEEALRKQYLRSHGAGVGKVIEQIEVVE